jgi:hypothetical protein
MTSSPLSFGAAPQGDAASFPDLTANVAAQFPATAKPISNIEKNLLAVSPYQEEPHLLDLNTLDTANQLLAKALICMKNLRGDYATADYEESFNWPEIVTSLQQLAVAANFEWKEAVFYIVVFRSQIPPTTAYTDLGLLDKPAHAEAMKSGGFLK